MMSCAWLHAVYAQWKSDAHLLLRLHAHSTRVLTAHGVVVRRAHKAPPVLEALHKGALVQGVPRGVVAAMAAGQVEPPPPHIPAPAMLCQTPIISPAVYKEALVQGVSQGVVAAVAAGQVLVGT